ncbi:phenylalanine--tRNA ligase subunit beta [Magnetococcales bacterium HHB-1]
MKFTKKWLQEHLPVTLSAEEIGEKLTMAGLELESLVNLNEGFEQVRVGYLEKVEKHPDADRLTVCQVRLGESTSTIVCGATNHKAGDKVAVALPGAKLPNGMKIRKGKIRGQVSEGMLCSEQELGLAEEAEGIIILPEDTPENQPIGEVLDRNDDLFECDLTPNRGDCLGVRGIARDLGAILALDMKPCLPQVEIDASIAEKYPVAIEIKDPEGCPRYTGRVIEGVKVGPSPLWLRNRLEAVGIRSINNIVDITNYILMDLGQPLHAFDLEQLAPPIVVRCADKDEKLLTLDGEERTLSSNMTLIADQKRALALAGIMGGENSGVEESTTTIFLESAYFNPVRTARTGRALNILSDSRYRFERGVDPEGILFALDRATALIIELAGGRAGPSITTDAGSWQPVEPIGFQVKRSNQLTGLKLSDEESLEILTRLGCVVTEKKMDHIFLQPPSHRHDLLKEEDLIEEIVRVYGYDRVDVEMPSGPKEAPPRGAREKLKRATRQSLTALGYLEAINYAFLEPEKLTAFSSSPKPVRLLNPISEEMAEMRTTLVPGLVNTAQYNLSRGNHRFQIYEMGRVFLESESLEEVEKLAGVISGAASDRAWFEKERIRDYFDLKGDLETLLEELNALSVQYRLAGPEFLHPGQKAEITVRLGKSVEVLGWMGQLHPSWQNQLALSQPIYLFEWDLSILQKIAFRAKKSVTISRFPPVQRDFAFIVEQSLAVEEVFQAIRRVDRNKLIQDVTLFDVYTGEHVPEGKKSLALGLFLQSTERTLDEKEIQTLSDRVIETMQKRFDAILRG